MSRMTLLEEKLTKLFRKRRPKSKWQTAKMLAKYLDENDWETVRLMETERGEQWCNEWMGQVMQKACPDLYAISDNDDVIVLI